MHRRNFADPSLLLFARQMCVPKVWLFFLLAALVPGRVDAGLECDSHYGYLRDPSKCWAADIMRAFGGRGLKCDSGNVRRKGGCCRAERPAHLQGRAAGTVPAHLGREGCPRTARLALAFNTFSFLLFTPLIAMVLIIPTSRFPMLWNTPACSISAHTTMRAPAMQ